MFEEDKCGGDAPRCKFGGVIMYRKQRFLTGFTLIELLVVIFIIGIFTDLLLFGLFLWLLKYSGYDISHIKSVVFAALGLVSLIYVFSCKSLRKNLWQMNLWHNKFLLLSFVFGIMFLIGAVYISPLQILLKTEPLHIIDWGLILGLALINIVLIEATKWWFIHKKTK